MFLCPWDFPGKSIRVGCHFLFQRIFLTQGLNLGLLHCRQMLYHLNHQGSQQRHNADIERYTMLSHVYIHVNTTTIRTQNYFIITNISLYFCFKSLGFLTVVYFDDLGSSSSVKVSTKMFLSHGGLGRKCIHSSLV